MKPPCHIAVSHLRMAIRLCIKQYRAVVGVFTTVVGLIPEVKISISILSARFYLAKGVSKPLITTRNKDAEPMGRGSKPLQATYNTPPYLFVSLM